VPTLPSSALRIEFDHPSWKAQFFEIRLTGLDPLNIPVWGPLTRIHPFSYTVEPDVGWDGTIQVLVSNSPSTPDDIGTNKSQLGDPITGPLPFEQDAPYQWLGVMQTVLPTNVLLGVTVRVICSPYSRNIQP
jgi:hypothetical protein